MNTLSPQLESQLPSQEELEDINNYLCSEDVSILDSKYQEVEDLLRFWRSILGAS